MNKLMLFILLAIGEIFTVSWYIMLMIGILHAHVFPALIPLGYGPSLGLGTTISFAFGCMWGYNRIWERING